MKKLMSKICLFDLILVLLAVCAGAFLWTGLHGEPVEPDPSAAWFLADIRRASDRYTDQEALKEQKLYNVSVVVRIDDISTDFAPNLETMETGMEILEHFSGEKLGELEAFTVTDNGDGTLDAMLKIRIYANMDMTKITTQFGMTLRVGQSLSTETVHRACLGEGTVTWISH